VTCPSVPWAQGVRLVDGGGRDVQIGARARVASVSVATRRTFGNGSSRRCQSPKPRHSRVSTIPGAVHPSDTYPMTTDQPPGPATRTTNHRKPKAMRRIGRKDDDRLRARCLCSRYRRKQHSVATTPNPVINRPPCQYRPVSSSQNTSQSRVFSQLRTAATPRKTALFDNPRDSGHVNVKCRVVDAPHRIQHHGLLWTARPGAREWSKAQII
jgi:hypothetical protein